MDILFATISKIKAPTTKLEVYSTLNQNLVGSSDTILWNNDTLCIDKETYEKLRLAIKPKICTFYTLNKILPYHDFCIALLCSISYSLNHITVPQVSGKTYTSAWRTMVVIADTGEEDVRKWIKARLDDRTSFGYSTSLDVNFQNVTNTVRAFIDDRQPSKLTKDSGILIRACTSRKVVDLFKSTPAVLVPIVSKTSSTPESQLDGLRTIHTVLLSKGF